MTDRSVKMTATYTNLERAAKVINSIPQATFDLYVQYLAEVNANPDESTTDYIKCVEGIFLDRLTSEAIRSWGPKS